MPWIIGVSIEESVENRKEQLQGMKNLTEEQLQTLGIVKGVLRGLNHELRLHPKEEDMHNRDNWHPVYTAYMDLLHDFQLNDSNNKFMYSDGYEAGFNPYDFIKKFR